MYGNPSTKKGARLLLLSAKWYTDVWFQEGSPSTTADDYHYDDDYLFNDYDTREDDETGTEEETNGRENPLLLLLLW